MNMLCDIAVEYTSAGTKNVGIYIVVWVVFCGQPFLSSFTKQSHDDDASCVHIQNINSINCYIFESPRP